MTIEQQMANTYTQLLIHVVFSVKFRHKLIKEHFREELEKYMCGIISNKKCKPLAIYCNPDHCHILIGLNPSVSISNLLQIVKSDSTEFIKRNKWTMGQFAWQSGYGAFAHSKEKMPLLIKYIRNQPEHHKAKSFRDEYMDLLHEAKISYDEKYLFDFF